MVQNHVLQMLAYVCMETPGSFSPEAIQDEKAKLLESVRIYSASEVPGHFVRGQYGPSYENHGGQLKPGYRQEQGVAPQSRTETYTAGRLSIDNWRWSGVAIVKKGDLADEMYLICRGKVEVIDDAGNVISTLEDGEFFGEIGLLMSIPRTATVRTKTLCDIFVLHRSDFVHILNDHPQFAETITKVARKRYEVVVTREDLLTLT